MTDHTPGPWHLDDELPPNSRDVIARVGCAGLGIPISANVYGAQKRDGSEVRNNARLIAASPDLLEIARGTASYLEDDSRSPRRRQTLLEATRAAIAKATKG